MTRFSRCSCGETKPSDPHLAFFQFRGEGSEEATEICVCGYHRVAHDPEYTARNVHKTTIIEDGLCTGFRPRGPQEFDSHYCGHSGWD